MYKLIKYGNGIIYIVNFLAVYSFFQRDVFIYDRGLVTPIYLDTVGPMPYVKPYYGLAMPEELDELDEKDYLIFDIGGKK